MEKSHIRFYILTRFKLGFDARSIHADFSDAYGIDTPSYRTVARWVARLKEGREDLEDDERVGRLITVSTQANIKKIRA